ICNSSAPPLTRLTSPLSSDYHCWYNGITFHLSEQQTGPRPFVWCGRRVMTERPRMDALPHFPQHRPVTLACHGVVAAPHDLAAQAGLGMLQAGGNALDAAIAANAVLQVVMPFVVGLGGDLFLLLHDARSSRLYGLNASGRAPAAATIERYHALGYSD